MSTYGPEYRLLWPAALFQEEARRIAGIEDPLDRSEQAHTLVSDAFASGVPVRDLSATFQHNIWEPESYNATGELLLRLAKDAASFPSQPRKYWRQRQQQKALAPQEVSAIDLQSIWVDIVRTLDADGYLDAVEPSPCADGHSEDERHEALGLRLSDETGFAVSWPLDVPHGGWADEDFFTLVEVLHDLVERPVRRWYHDFDRSMHALSFAAKPGRALYRWRVNQAFEGSSIRLRLSEDGPDQGLLVHASRDGRDDLVKRVAERTEPRSDPVVRAVTMFRDRNADRIQKRTACILLANQLEQVRDRVKERLLTKDEGMLFRIANQFAIRHQRADQHADYDDAYLDWVFWTYLATIELLEALASRVE